MYPTWRDGKQTSSHRRSFASRYDPIRDWLTCENLYGFTVLDFGAGGGYFTARLVEDFDAIVTAVECDPHAYHNLSLSGTHTIITDRLDANDITALGRFDVVLALSVLHHCTDWRSIYDALLAAGEIVFIEVAHPLEYLPHAAAHNQSTAIVNTLKGDVLTLTPGYDARYSRTLTVIDQRL